MKKKVMIIISISLVIISAGLLTYLIMDNINLKNNISNAEINKIETNNNINLNDNEIAVLKETLDKKTEEKKFEVKVYEVWKKNNEKVLNYLK